MMRLITFIGTALEFGFLVIDRVATILAVAYLIAFAVAVSVYLSGN